MCANNKQSVKISTTAIAESAPEINNKKARTAHTAHTHSLIRKVASAGRTANGSLRESVEQLKFNSVFVLFRNAISTERKTDEMANEMKQTDLLVFQIKIEK